MTTREYLELDKKSPWYSKDYTSEEEREADKKAIRDFNRELTNKYPWLVPRNRFSDKVVNDYEYQFTELDEMPNGWRIAFGDEMCERLQKELEKFNYVNEFRILQIKEKFGSLRFYTNGTPIGKLSEEPVEIIYQPEWSYSWMYDENHKVKPEYKDKHVICDNEETEQGFKFEVYDILDKCLINDIINEYECKSEKICFKCGEPAKWITTGWICPWCSKCKEKAEEHIHDNFAPIEEWFMKNEDN